MYRVGETWKIRLKDGSVFTALITKVEKDRLYFTDLYGEKNFAQFDDIRRGHVVKGVNDDVGGRYAKTR